MLPIIDRPCVKAKLILPRGRETACPRFRRDVRGITGFLSGEALRHLESEAKAGFE